MKLVADISKVPSNGPVTTATLFSTVSTGNGVDCTAPAAKTKPTANPKRIGEVFMGIFQKVEGLGAGQPVAAIT
jgi:hypothetical protein